MFIQKKRKLISEKGIKKVIKNNRKFQGKILLEWNTKLLNVILFRPFNIKIWSLSHVRLVLILNTLQTN